MNEELNYKEAFEELQQIVRAVEYDNIALDELSAKVKRAIVLIKICQDKLNHTELDIKQILAELEKPDKSLL